MIDLTKCWEKLDRIGFNATTNRKYRFLSEAILTKMRMLRDESDKTNSEGKPLTIPQKLEDYKKSHDGKEFQADISTKTLEILAQLCQCQPAELFDWIPIDLDPKEGYEYRVKNEIQSPTRRINKDS